VYGHYIFLHELSKVKIEERCKLPCPLKWPHSQLVLEIMIHEAFEKGLLDGEQLTEITHTPNSGPETHDVVSTWQGHRNL
jgi:hypothetical protein